MRALLVGFAVLLAGCVAPAPGALRTDGTPAPSEAHVVVGLVDSGVNPYHEVFQDATATLPPGILDPATGLPPGTIRLAREGSFRERVNADASTWAGLEPGRLYWFEGTRLLAVSMLPPGGSPLILEGASHGTGVASTVRNVSGEAWIVLVQAAFFGPGSADPMDDLFDSKSRGVAWLSEQPWVDVISLSVGLEGNPPVPFWRDFALATRHAAEQGKLVAVAAGNLPTPTVGSGTNGPPWVISVGGVDPAAHGEFPEAAKVVDVVSDYIREVAGEEPEEYVSRGGTSIATPVVAGALANALLELRRSVNAVAPYGGARCAGDGVDIGPADLRNAMNLTGQYWSIGDYQPPALDGDPLEVAFGTAIPILPTPWVQMGWGYVGPEHGALIASFLLGQASAAKASDAVLYMDVQHGLRATYWGAQLEA